MKTQILGRAGEDKALSYLKDQGLNCITQNYNCRLGEIDLIMQDGEYLVFVEVRSRVSASFGGGVGSITYAKQKKIIKTALHYTMIHKNHNKLAMRFDVVSLDGKSASITWLKNAFGADY